MQTEKVYVIAKSGKPLMPTHPARARKLLARGKAKPVTTNPFTIRLTYDSGENVQPVTLGIDAGYAKAGFSAVTEKDELISGELTLLKGMSERIEKRAMHRGGRKSRTGYRKPRPHKDTKEDGWIPPSIQHKLDSHIRLAEKLGKFLPITDVVVEVANFDIQKIKDPDIEGKEYQQGELYGYYNLREYVLHRDGHKCQNPKCRHKGLPLEIHHIIYRKNNGPDAPWNLIALCIGCHTAGAHNTWLKDWKPELHGFKAETFMTMVRWKMMDRFSGLYENVRHTYGYMTKLGRKTLGLEKSHANDAFVIAGGTAQSRCRQIDFKQVRRNNRCLETWYDAVYIDTRTGKPAKASVLNNGRKKRNTHIPVENLRPLRGKKLRDGSRSIRRERYPFQPNDKVIYENRIYTVIGTQNKGTCVKLKTDGKPLFVSPKKLKIYTYGKGIVAA